MATFTAPMGVITQTPPGEIKDYTAPNEIKGKRMEGLDVPSPQ